MAVSPGKTYLRALGLGALTGARSVTPLELVAIGWKLRLLSR